jgi:hypothetical protein
LALFPPHIYERQHPSIIIIIVILLRIPKTVAIVFILLAHGRPNQEGDGQQQRDDHRPAVRGHLRVARDVLVALVLGLGIDLHLQAQGGGGPGGGGHYYYRGGRDPNDEGGGRGGDDDDAAISASGGSGGGGGGTDRRERRCNVDRDDRDDKEGGYEFVHNMGEVFLFWDREKKRRMQNEMIACSFVGERGKERDWLKR